MTLSYTEYNTTARMEWYSWPGSSRLGMVQPQIVWKPGDSPEPGIPYFKQNKNQVYGARRYEITNHLGNVAAVISDRKMPFVHQTNVFFDAVVHSAADYFPFGSLMTERTYSAGGYRYGFNTQEKVDEVKGTGNHYSAQFWEYDPRVVHRWNIDPRPNPSMSPYAILGGNPIFFTDILGDTIKGDLQSYNMYKSRVESGISHYDQRIERFSSRIERRTEAGKNVGSGLKRRLQEAELMKSSFKSVMNELTGLENSTQVYYINSSYQGRGGSLSFDASTNNVMVNVSPSMNLIEGLSHELKHAHQFESGKLSLTSTGLGGHLYDLQDEVAAFRRSQLFGFYSGETINNEWVLRRGYSSLSSRTTQLTMNTPAANFPGAPTIGQQIKLSIYQSGRKGTAPAQIIKDWQIYYLGGAWRRIKP